MMMQTDIAGNLAAVWAEIDKAAKEVGRQRDLVDLVAVSKTKPEAEIRPALTAGHRLFGENRVHEAAEKWPRLKAEFPDTRLHLIGPLQTNKVGLAVPLFDVIETLDRPKLARYLARAQDDLGRSLDCYIQVNTGAEPQKAGVLPEEADGFVAACRVEYGLSVVGLMCIPPQDEEPSLHFALLARIAERNGLSRLSMGMSGDYPVAVQFGATSVRVGTAIFGARPPISPKS
ncbi:YggS family pyridoxal phosphate-dependent enzyme [Magnetospira sp. QH-2]|uniref:YggS family pyridoxal phosphate-dependent enzyme n=1 Tax=Magnetospira sp. (strain QH-2) TaxID=1288970 RepID=UPI0003E80F2E|nr:YggS family pyridoxal phosphate-dependent enzyme [Magnetospira sp. QH-2]CCQ75599.1 conserved hypothetical protein of unknown function[Include Alanine racemase N-terminal domain] [Magnetospira sp. QH-2]